MRYAVTRIGYVYRLDYIRTPRFGSAPEVLSPFHLRVVDSGSYNACRHRSSSHTQRFDRALDMLCARIVDGVRRQSTRTCFSDVVDAGPRKRRRHTQRDSPPKCAHHSATLRPHLAGAVLQQSVSRLLNIHTLRRQPTGSASSTLCLMNMDMQHVFSM